MAKVTFSPLITKLSGSLGSVTFSGQGGNATVRLKPYNPASNNQNQHRWFVYREAAYASWRGLSAAKKAFVYNFISLYPKYALASGGIERSAMYHYISWYCYILAAGYTPALAFVIDPPLTGYRIYTIGGTSPNIVVEYEGVKSLSIVPVIYVSKAFNRNYSSDSRHVSQLRSVTSPLLSRQNIGASFIARYGMWPKSGQIFWIGGLAVHLSNLHFSDYSVSVYQF